MIRVLIIIRGTVAQQASRLSACGFRSGVKGGGGEAKSLCCRRRHTPHNGPHARNQLYHLVLDAAVGFLAEATLVCRGGEADCCFVSLGCAFGFPVFHSAPDEISRGDARPPSQVNISRYGLNVPRARKRSSEGMQMALRRRMVTAEAMSAGGARWGVVGSGPYRR
jgi:hypothetical protein